MKKRCLRLGGATENSHLEQLAAPQATPPGETPEFRNRIKTTYQVPIMLLRLVTSASVILGLSVPLCAAAQSVPNRCPRVPGVAVISIRDGICYYTQNRNIRTVEQAQRTHQLRRQNLRQTLFTPRRAKSIDKFDPPKGGAPAETNGAGSRKGK